MKLILFFFIALCISEIAFSQNPSQYDIHNCDSKYCVADAWNGIIVEAGWEHNGVGYGWLIEFWNTNSRGVLFNAAIEIDGGNNTYHMELSAGLSTKKLYQFGNELIVYMSDLSFSPRRRIRFVFKKIPDPPGPPKAKQ